MACCGKNPTFLLLPNKPSTCGGGSSSSSSPGSTIQNGRLVRGRRRHSPYYSRHLHRASQVIQDPRQINFREVCFLVWALYASYNFYFSARAAWHMLAVVDVWVLCDMGQSLMGCGREVSWEMLSVFYSYLAEVVPWAILCAGVAFVGEEVLRQRR